MSSSVVMLSGLFRGLPHCKAPAEAMFLLAPRRTLRYLNDTHIKNSSAALEGEQLGGPCPPLDGADHVPVDSVAGGSRWERRDHPSPLTRGQRAPKAWPNFPRSLRRRRAGVMWKKRSISSNSTSTRPSC